MNFSSTGIEPVTFRYDLSITVERDSQLHHKEFIRLLKSVGGISTHGDWGMHAAAGQLESHMHPDLFGSLIYLSYNEMLTTDESRELLQ